MTITLEQRELAALRKLVMGQEDLLRGVPGRGEALERVEQARAELQAIAQDRALTASHGAVTDSEIAHASCAALTAWLQSGHHLPAWLRDFHDQKEVFKTVGEMPAQEATSRISWVDGHIYVVDRFLWHMGRWGYTLQRSRAKQDFDDMDADIQARRVKEQQAHSAMLPHLEEKRKDEEVLALAFAAMYEHDRARS